MIPRSGRAAWTAEEVHRLRELAGSGLRVNDIARRLGRSYASVQHKGQSEGIGFAHTLGSARAPIAVKPRSVALVTDADSHPALEDVEPLERRLRDKGLRVRIADWDHPEVRWSNHDAALLCFLWRHCVCSPAFRAWATRVSRLTVLIEPLHGRCWTASEHEAAAGASTVPHRFQNVTRISECVRIVMRYLSSDNRSAPDRESWQTKRCRAVSDGV